MDDLTKANIERWRQGNPSMQDSFWRYMAEQYKGVGWYETYGERIPRAWLDSIYTMTPEEAKAGCKELRKKELYGLPTLADFEQACKRALMRDKPVAPVTRKLPEPKEKRKERMSKASEYVKSIKEGLK